MKKKIFYIIAFLAWAGNGALSAYHNGSIDGSAIKGYLLISLICAGIAWLSTLQSTDKPLNLYNRS